MNEPHPTPVAVVGVGRMGRHHARIYHELDQAELLAVVDAETDRADALADKFGCDSLANVEQLLQRYPQVKAASVAVPTIVHEPVASKLIERGVACLVEKPLADTPANARRIAELGRVRGVLVQVGHTERFNPAVRAIADWNIRPRFIECDRVSPMTFRSIDVSVVFDMMIHDLDILLNMVHSPLVEVRACGVALLSDKEDVADARLVFADGTVAKITASRLALKTERKLRVLSEDGYISLDYAAKSGIAIRRTGNIEALLEIRDQIARGCDLSDLNYYDLVNIQELSINDEEPLRAELLNFLDAVHGKQLPECDAQAGFAAVDVAQKIIDAIAEHHWDGIDTRKLV